MSISYAVFCLKKKKIKNPHHDIKQNAQKKPSMLIFSIVLRPHCLFSSIFIFFFTHTATTEIYTLSLHDALPILFDFHALGSLELKNKVREVFKDQLGTLIHLNERPS